jgi:hypothetical protein
MGQDVPMKNNGSLCMWAASQSNFRRPLAWPHTLHTPYFLVCSIFLTHAHTDAHSFLLCGASTVVGQQIQLPIAATSSTFPSGQTCLPPPPLCLGRCSKPGRSLALATRAQPLLHTLHNSSPFELGLPYSVPPLASGLPSWRPPT